MLWGPRPTLSVESFLYLLASPSGLHVLPNSSFFLFVGFSNVTLFSPAIRPVLPNFEKACVCCSFLLQTAAVFSQQLRFHIFTISRLADKAPDDLMRRLTKFKRLGAWNDDAMRFRPPSTGLTIHGFDSTRALR